MMDDELAALVEAELRAAQAARQEEDELWADLELLRQQDEAEEQ